MKNSDTQTWEWKLLLKLKKSKVKILVTGCAGFIGSNLVDALLMQGYGVTGIDNFNDYYDPLVKRQNLKQALVSKSFKLYEADIVNESKLVEIFEKEKPSIVIHLAARAGVRPSLENPLLYAATNVLGTVNLLKLSAEFKISRFIFGSSSSVYGETDIIPFTEDDKCLNIISPYGASKRAAEFFIESFYHSFGLRCVILRFFTVYGQRGRPDMAPAIFTDAILNGRKLTIFGNGDASRDFTYISDIIGGIVGAIGLKSDFEIINLGGNKPVTVKEFIKLIENISGKRANIVKGSSVSGDVKKTWANIQKAKTILNWQPKMPLAEGIALYVDWYKSH